MRGAHKSSALSVIFILNIYLLNFISTGVVHSHTNELNREREADGAYSPRDHGHYSENGEHHSEFDHEAILGSRKEAEEFDHNLSPEEAKERLKIILEKMDLDNDKFISRNELKAWILRSFRKLSEEEALERFEDADENHDGLISWSEYVLDTYGNDGIGPHYGDDEEDVIQEDRLLWKRADRDWDRLLNKEEWESFIHPEEHLMMLQVILRQTLEKKDKDEDRAISFQEFIGERGQEHDKDWLRVEKEKFDKEFDTNGDGKLTGGEILTWIIPSNNEIADEEVDHLFMASDDDHDDVLSFDEVLEHYDTFVGSEATDYGDHLYNIPNFKNEL